MLFRLIDQGMAPEMIAGSSAKRVTWRALQTSRWWSGF